MKYVGIQTQIWRNNRNTIILLLMFPVILLGMVLGTIMVLDWIGFFCWDGVCPPGLQATTFHWDIVWRYFLDAMPFTLSMTAIWFIIAYFTNTYTLTRYVKLPDTLALRTSYARRGSTGCTTTFIGSNVTLASGLEYKGTDALVQRWFASVTSPGDLKMIHSEIAGKLAVSGKLSFSGGIGLLDFGAFADSADAVREGDLSIGSLVAGSGDKIFRGPAALPNATNGVWTVTAGSPYLTWVSGPKGNRLAVGGALHGTGIPDGAFVKRIFSDSYIEMSADGNGTGGDSSVTFDAFVPQMTVRIPSCDIQAWPSFFFEKRSQESDVRFEVGRLTATDAKFPFPVKLTDGYHPATVVIGNASAFKGKVLPAKAHMEFAAGAGWTSGFPQSRMDLGGTADGNVRLTVTNGISAQVASITNIAGVLTKDGAGTLTAHLDGANDGTLSVEGGCFVLADAETAMVGTLALSAGASVRVPEGMTLSVQTLTAAPGAVLEGPGTISVTGGDLPDLSGVILTGGVQIALAGAKGEPVLDVPAATAPAGVPVFWVDASDETSLVKDETTGAVTRWNDRRGSGFLFATNVIHAPTWSEGAYGKCVSFAHKQMEYHYVTNEEVLVWSDIVKDIRAVFAVLDAKSQGGYLLGASSRPEIQGRPELALGGFMRRDNSGWEAPILAAAIQVEGDRLYIDGDEESIGTSFMGPGIQVVEYHNRSHRTCWADAFGTGAAGSDNQVFGGNFFTVRKFHFVFALTVRMDMGYRTFKAEFHFVLEVFIGGLEHFQIVFRAQMADAGSQQVQIMLDGLVADVAVFRAEYLSRSPVLHVDFIYIIDEVHDFFVRQVFIEPAAELGGEVVFAIGESTGTTEAAHDAAGLAANAAFHLACGNGADTGIDILTALEQQYFELGAFFCQFISGKDTGGATAHNHNIILLHRYFLLILHTRKERRFSLYQDILRLRLSAFIPSVFRKTLAIIREDFR